MFSKEGSRIVTTGDPVASFEEIPPDFRTRSPDADAAVGIACCRTLPGAFPPRAERSPAVVGTTGRKTAEGAGAQGYSRRLSWGRGPVTRQVTARCRPCVLRKAMSCGHVLTSDPSPPFPFRGTYVLIISFSSLSMHYLCAHKGNPPPGCVRGTMPPDIVGGPVRHPGRSLPTDWEVIPDILGGLMRAPTGALGARL